MFKIVAAGLERSEVVCPNCHYLFINYLDKKGYIDKKDNDLRELKTTGGDDIGVFQCKLCNTVLEWVPKSE